MDNFQPDLITKCLWTCFPMSLSTLVKQSPEMTLSLLGRYLNARDGREGRGWGCHSCCQALIWPRLWELDLSSICNSASRFLDDLRKVNWLLILQLIFFPNCVICLITLFTDMIINHSFHWHDQKWIRVLISEASVT